MPRSKPAPQSVQKEQAEQAKLREALKHTPIKQLRMLAKQIHAQRTAEKQKDPVADYVPHAQQEPFHRCDKFIRLLSGGNRSGKTHGGIMEDCYWLKGVHPFLSDIQKPPIRGRIVSTDFGKGINEVIIPKLRALMPKADIKRWIRDSRGQYSGLELRNGSYVDFMVHTQDVKQFAGVELDFVHFDEPPPEDIYNESVMRVLTKNGRIWFTMTPLQEPWTHELLWKPGMDGDPDIGCFEMSTYDNPHIDPGMIEKLQKATSTEGEREARLFGRYKHMLNRVYGEFEAQTHVISPKVLLEPKYYEIIDPHPKKPHAVSIFALTPDNMLYQVSEALVKGDMVQLGTHVLKMRKSIGYAQPTLIVVDVSTMLKDSNYSPFNIRTQLQSIIGNFISAEKDPYAGIDTVKQRLRATIELFSEPDPSKRNIWALHGLQIFNTCKETIRQAEGYVWDTGFSTRTKTGRRDDIAKPLKRNDDFMDNLRYICILKPTYNKSHQAFLINSKGRPNSYAKKTILPHNQATPRPSPRKKSRIRRYNPFR